MGKKGECKDGKALIGKIMGRLLLWFRKVGEGLGRLEAGERSFYEEN